MRVCVYVSHTCPMIVLLNTPMSRMLHDMGDMRDMTCVNFRKSSQGRVRHKLSYFLALLRVTRRVMYVHNHMCDTCDMTCINLRKSSQGRVRHYCPSFLSFFVIEVLDTTTSHMTCVARVT